MKKKIKTNFKILYKPIGGLTAIIHYGLFLFLSLFGFYKAGNKQLEFASLCINPFGKDIIETDSIPENTFPLGIICCAAHLLCACFNIGSIVGIVFAEEHIKLAFLSLAPNSKSIYEYSDPLHFNDKNYFPKE